MLRKIIKFGLAGSLILPLVFISWTMYPSHFGKTVFFQILIALLGFLAVTLVAVKKEQFFVFRKIDWAVIIFFLVLLVTSFFGNNFNRSFWSDQSRIQGVFTLAHFIIFYFLLRQFVSTRNDWKKFLGLALAVALLSSLVAWFGFSIPGIKDYILEGVRLSGLIGNPIFLANYLILPVFIGIYYFLRFKDSAWRWLGALSGLASLITIFGTRTRGVFIGIMAGAVLAITLYFIFLAGKKLKIGLIAGAGLAIIIWSSGLIFPAVRNFLPASISFIYSISLNDTTAQTRIMAWEIALKGLKDSPIIGHGLESYQAIYDKYYNPKFLAYSFQETVWDQPHNFVLEVANSAGIIGVISYLVFLGFIFFGLYGKIKEEENKSDRAGLIFIFAGIGAYVVALLFSFETSNSLQLWFLVLALATFVIESDRREERLVKDRYLNLLFIASFIFFLVSAFMGFRMLKASYYTSLARDAKAIQSNFIWEKYALKAMETPVPFRWDVAINLTMDLANFDAWGKLDRETLDPVAYKMEEELLANDKKYPETYLYKFWLGQLYSFMGEYLDNAYYKKAEEVLLSAKSINQDRQQIPLLLGKLYFLTGELEKSEAVLGELAFKNPDYPEPHWYYGLALMLNKKRSEGILELEKGSGFAFSMPANIRYLIDIYAGEKNYEKIIPLYENLIAREPQNAQNYASLAATYMVLGDKFMAKEYIGKAVELNPALREEAINFLKENGVEM
ncbi:MAG: O-antigen ligase family protein [Patescibacteria group bacterium]|jgi:O-antigen ligase/tetratricopeptide (TPR) repeat protein